jgi:hypothetical protein
MNTQAQLLYKLKDLGWTVSMCGSQHYKLVPPHRDMRIVIASYTASDHRAYMNIRADIRRAYKVTGRESPI